MSLATLNRYDKITASAILSEAVLSHGKSEQISLRAKKYAAEINELLEEVRVQLALDANDNSKTASSKIEQRLSREIRNIIMDGFSEKDVIEKLGGEGRLPLSAYKIEFSENVLKDYRESAKTILLALRNPDEVQHITTVGQDREVIKGATLLLKQVASANGGQHWLLVVTRRMKESLFVQAILRVSPKIINLDGTKSPLDMLSAFMQHYGRDFIVPGIPGAQRLLVDKEVLGPIGQYPRTLVDPVGAVKLYEIGYTVIMPEMDFNIRTHIILSYAVDMQSYHRDKIKF